MTLGDREILELNELCGAVVDGNLTDAQRDRLNRWLRESDAARRFYVRAVGQSASLQSYAAETHAEAPDAPPAPRPSIIRAVFGWSAAAAAAVVVCFWWVSRAAVDRASATVNGSEFVARVTGSKNSQWAGAAVKPGDLLGKNQRLDLASGLAEITFDSGARVVLEGPASLDVNSAWNGTLRHGTLKASVPPEAIGFKISNPAVEVVDLGTEFTMIADGNGAAEVLVLKGEVEAAPHAAADQDTILLRENESRRFASSGVSTVSDSRRKFALFTAPLALDYFAAPVNTVHWSFDEGDGRVARAEVRGTLPGSFDLELHSETPGDLAAAHPTGQRSSALSLDGKLYARASFTGLSGSTTHSVAFWVKVPKDAQLSDAYSMVTWGLKSKKLGNRQVGINWNKNPADGPLGVIRTDFRGGHALGTTALRDGNWHHITVVFAPGDDDSPVQVRQYVDARLESSTITPDAMHAEARASDAQAMADLTDVLWLGCRLGIQGHGTGRFRGEIDELFIADRSLEPQEIVSLMNDNCLPSAPLATTTPATGSGGGL